MIKFYTKITSLSFIYTNLLLAFCLLLMASCDEEETLPTFIQIDKLQLETNISQGTNQHNINNVWLFVDGQGLGVYELPATIPILAAQEASISIRAGIANNGISSTHIIYPFWAPYAFQLTPNPGGTTPIAPQFKYINSMIFDFINDFEQGNNFIDLGGAAALQLTSNSSLVFQGDRSGRITLGEEANNFSIITTDKYELPGNKKAVFLEMTYKCTIAFQIIVRGSQSSSTEQRDLAALIVNPQEEWNTIYVDLTDEASILNDSGYTRHQLIFQSSLPTDVSQASFFWDNLKLLHQL